MAPMFLHNSDGKVHWEPSDIGTVTVTIGRETEELEFPNAENLHLPLVEDFVSAVVEDRPPAIPVADALKTNKLLDGIYESAKSGKAVAIS